MPSLALGTAAVPGPDPHGATSATPPLGIRACFPPLFPAFLQPSSRKGVGGHRETTGDAEMSKWGKVHRQSDWFVHRPYCTRQPERASRPQRQYKTNSATSFCQSKKALYVKSKLGAVCFRGRAKLTIKVSYPSKRVQTLIRLNGADNYLKCLASSDGVTSETAIWPLTMPPYRENRTCCCPGNLY